MPNSIEITTESGAYFNLDLMPDGSFEIGADNGKDSYSGENRSAYTRIASEDAPEALMAITNWIDALSTRVRA